ncbi:MAG: phosphoenolpyruvate synthase, partial [Trebonia sp.]
MNDRYVLGLEEIDRTRVAVVGGKGAHLGELSRIEGVRVPAGFCVTTQACRRIMTTVPSIDDLLDRLSRLGGDDQRAIRALSAQIRTGIEAAGIPDDLAGEIGRAVARLGEDAAYAVRSSATAEDLPTASFAGQQDTYLNVMGRAEIVSHVGRCLASLFTERAVTYRLRNAFDHRKVNMAVVVQRMVFPRVAGVLFTADPVTSNRKVAWIEASFGLGEALVSGLVNADTYRVRDGEVTGKTVAVKKLAVQPAPAGGTRRVAIEPENQERQALSDDQITCLARLGQRIEAHLGRPQDVEWCLADGEFQIVQSRPITTLFPVPVTGDQANHVYVSVGHQQMMTDAMRPLGLSVWQLTTPRPMAEAGGRLFVDVTRLLGSETTRAGFLNLVGRSDPLLGDALRTVIERGDFIPAVADEAQETPPAAMAAPASTEADPAIVSELVERSRASLATLKRDIKAMSGAALVEFIFKDFKELRRVLFDPRGLQVIMAGMRATWRLNELLEEWLGEKNAVDTLTQSVPGNVTSEMGLELLDVADVIRPHPAVVDFFLAQVKDGDFLNELSALDGGREARNAIRSYLDKYGMRCVGEIDITTPRWSE